MSPEFFPSGPIHAMRTDLGRIRRGNEDTCAADPAVGAYLVCDGMGGAAAGEVASQMTADDFLGRLGGEEMAGGSAGAEPGAARRLARAIHATNQVVFRRSRQTRTLNGMGTTIVALLLDPPVAPHDVYVLHVGDSRCYLLRAGVLHALTRDHSLVEEQVREGLISRLQAEHSPLRNMITRAIGSHPEVEPEIQVHRPESGDVYLLASDGLTRELTDGEIAEHLCELPGEPCQGDLQRGCERLIDAANACGGHDNITVLLLCVP